MLGQTIRSLDNEFGSKRVTVDSATGMHCFLHDGTLHGLQCFAGGQETLPTGYFHEGGLFGSVMGLVRNKSCARVGVIGLGVGCLAPYVEVGQSLTFYEIDPQVIDIANDPACFTFLRDCRGECVVVEGDGLKGLALEDAGTFDLIMHDAFSGDTFSDDLIKDDAMELYRSRLRAGGVLAFHISMMADQDHDGGVRRILFERVKRSGFQLLLGDDMDLSAEDRADGRMGTRFLVCALDGEALLPLRGDQRWTVPEV
ncbi:MAG: hypothetical protein ACPGXK_01195 [Phycisphaerae bacterium]